MRKLIGFLLICLLAWQTYEQITFLSELLNGLLVDWEVLGDEADLFLSKYLVIAISSIIGLIILKITFIPLVTCSKCSNKMKKVAPNREVVIRLEKYKYTNKDGTKNMKRKDNILLHAWFEKYKCPKCSEVTTLEEFGEMPRNLYKEAKSLAKSQTDDLIASGESFNVIILTVKHRSKTKLSDYLKKKYGGYSAKYAKSIIDGLYEYQLAHRIDEAFTEKDSKVEAFYLTRSIGAQSVYVPHIDNWRDLELEERDKIVKEALKTNTDPSTEEVNEYIEKMRAL